MVSHGQDKAQCPTAASKWCQSFPDAAARHAKPQKPYKGWKVPIFWTCMI